MNTVMNYIKNPKYSFVRTELINIWASVCSSVKRLNYNFILIFKKLMWWSTGKMNEKVLNL